MVQNVTLTGLPAILDEVAREASPRDVKPLLGQFSVYLTATAKRRFDTQTDPDGTPWRPLAIPRLRPRDMANRKLPSGAPQGRQKALRDTGLLMASMGSISEISEDSLIHGSNVDYGPVHQHGVARRILPVRKKALFWPGALHPVKSTSGIPARPFIGLNDRDGDKLARMAADYFGGPP